MTIEEIEKEWENSLISGVVDNFDLEGITRALETLNFACEIIPDLLAVAKAAKEAWEYDEYGVPMSLAIALKELEKD